MIYLLYVIKISLFEINVMGLRTMIGCPEQDYSVIK